MDTFAHGAIGMLTASRSGLPGLRKGAAVRRPPLQDWTLWAALAFGTLPDLVSFGVYLVQRVFSGNFSPGKPALSEIPSYVFTAYDVSHSLVVAAAAGILIGIFARSCLLPYLAWPLHIFCDIPTHSADFFATPVFWPISEWHFDGWAFSEHPLLIMGYWGGIVLLFAWRMLLPPIRERIRPKQENNHV